MLRACYTTTIRPYRDSDREEEITWYFVPADRPFCGRSRFGSANYTDEDDVWTGAGEVQGRPRPFSNGQEPFVLAHHEPEGPRDWWENGCPVSAAGTLARSGNGAPEHCLGGVPGFLMGGVGRFGFAGVGGFLLGGSALFPAAPPIVSDGGGEFDGSVSLMSLHGGGEFDGDSWPSGSHGGGEFDGLVEVSGGGGGVDPGPDCDSAALIDLDVEYGPFTAVVGTDHWFRATAIAGSMKVVLNTSALTGLAGLTTFQGTCAGLSTIFAGTFGIGVSCAAGTYADGDAWIKIAASGAGASVTYTLKFSTGTCP